MFVQFEVKIKKLPTSYRELKSYSFAHSHDQSSHDRSKLTKFFILFYFFFACLWTKATGTFKARSINVQKTKNEANMPPS